MSASKHPMFERLEQEARANAINLVDSVLIDAGLHADLDEAGRRRLAERLVGGRGGAWQRRAVIRALHNLCDPDAYDVAFDLGGDR